MIPLDGLLDSKVESVYFVRKLQILPLNFTEFGWLEIDYNTISQPLSINLPQFYVRDVFIMIRSLLPTNIGDF